MLNQLLGKKDKAGLPRPLTDYVLDVDGVADVGLRLELKLRVTEEEPVRLTGPNIRTYVDGTVPRKTEKIERLKGAHYLESEWSDKIYIFATREAASDYVTQRVEGRAAQAQAIEAHRKARAEAEHELTETRAKLASLRERLTGAYEGFTETSLAAVKAEGDAEGLERRIKDLRAKIARPEPQQGMGAAIATQFACDTILTRGEIAEAVRAEREALLKRYRGLPDESTLHLGHAILLVTWRS